MDRKNLISMDKNITLLSNNISTSLTPPLVPLIPGFSLCSVPSFLIVFGHLSWFILFPYLRRKWNPRRKMMSNLHIESVMLIIFHLVYRFPCIVHMFSLDNPYINRKEYGYLVLPISLVLIFVVVKTAKYFYMRRVYPENFSRENILVVEPSEFHEETLDLPNQHHVSRKIQERHFAQGEYESIDEYEECKNPYNIPRLDETRMILNFLIFFSLVFLILVIVNPDTCFQKDPLPRFLLCAVYIGHLTSVIHKRILYDGYERPHVVAISAVVMLAIGICMFHVYEWHESTRVIIIITFEIIFGTAAIYIIICKILLRYTPTKSELLRTFLTCSFYLLLTLCTVIAGMKKLKVGLSLSKCTWVSEMKEILRRTREIEREN